MQVFSVPPNGHTMVLDHGGFFQVIQPIKVYNIGREIVYAESKYGTAMGWSGGIDKATVSPGEEARLETTLKPYMRNGLYLENYGDNRALVDCDYQNHHFGDFDQEGGREIEIDINDISKKFATFAVSKIPTVGPVLSIIVGFFWPDTKGPSVWDQIENEVGDLIDSKSNEVISGILGGELSYIEERITVFEQDLEKHVEGVSAHYMNIAEDLIGFEKKFIFTKEHNSNFGEVNFFILPMYSNMVTLKLTFYAFGILNQDEIGLSDEQVQRLRDYSERLVNDQRGAIHHVTEVMLERVQNELNYCIPNQVFDSVATVRTYCALNGTEYIAYWQELLMQPNMENKPYNDALCYSKGFGEPTSKQARQIIPIELEQPLTPELIDGKRNKFREFNVLWDSHKNEITCFVVHFENGDSYKMGPRFEIGEMHDIQFNGAYLSKLSAWGGEKLNRLEFTLSDGREVVVGSYPQGEREDFHLEDHHIAGIFLDGLFEDIGYATNITVSYQMTTEE